MRLLGAVDPDFSVHVGMHGRDHGRLRLVIEHFLLDRIEGELLGLAVEFRGAGLVHHTEPDIPLGVEFEIEISVGVAAGPRLRVSVFFHLPRFGIEPRQRVLAEIADPDITVITLHRVMRLHGFPRQVVGGDDHARIRAFRPRRGFQVEFEFRRA